MFRFLLPKACYGIWSDRVQMETPALPVFGKELQIKASMLHRQAYLDALIAVFSETAFLLQGIIWQEVLMEDDVIRIKKLMAGGNCCTQAIVKAGLEDLNKDDPLMVQAVGCLCGGLSSGLTCGALTGAACLIGLFAEGDEAMEMVSELVSWFIEEYAGDYGGTDCSQIIGGNAANRKLRCPGIVEDTYCQTKSILKDYGYAL